MATDLGGRAELIDAVAGRAEAALAAGSPVSAVLVTGAGGTGKSHALEAVEDRLRRRACTLRSACAAPQSATRPGAVLLALFPELMDLPEPPAAAPQRGPAAGGGGAAPTIPTSGLVRRALDVIEPLAAPGRPLAIMLDDAHLADALSLSTLHRLAHSAARLPLVVVAARRALPARGPLTMLAGSARTSETVLTAVTVPERDAMAAERLGAPPGPRLRRLLDATGGNPAHVHLALDWAEASGTLRAVPGTGEVDARLDTAELAQVLSRTVGAQLALLDPDALQTVRLAAVWGRPVSADELGRARGQHPGEFAGSLDAAVGAGLLRWDGDRIRFSSSAAAQVVRAGMDEPVHRMLSDAAAAATDPAMADPAGAEPHDDPATGPLLRVQSSLRYTGALPAAPEKPRGPTSVSLDLTDLDAVLARVGTLSETGNLRAADDLAARALGRHIDPAQAATLLFLRLTFAMIGARLDDAGRLTAAIRALPLPAETMAWLDEIDVWLRAMGGDPPRGAEEPAPPGAPAAAGQPGQAEAGINGHRAARAIGMTADGDCAGALAYIDGLIDTNASRRGWAGADVPGAAAWQLWLTRFAYGPSATLVRAPVGSTPDSHLVTRWLDPFRQDVLAEAHFAAGELELAAMLFDEAIADAGRIGSGWLSTAVANRALLDVHRGAAPDALARLARWRTAGAADRFGFADVDLAESEAHLATHARGRVPGSLRAAVRRLWQRTTAAGNTTWLLYRSSLIARQAAVAGLPEIAADVARAAESAWRHADSPALYGHVLLTGAVARHDLDVADEAAREFRAVGDTIGELAALEEAACAAAAHGTFTTARERANAACELADGIGSASTRQRLRIRLRRYGVVLGRTGPRGAHTGPGGNAPGAIGGTGAARARAPRAGRQALTPAEARVGRLLARGRTGPQIADALGISPRTVQTHVSNALGKLGLSTRAELAAYISHGGG